METSYTVRASAIFQSVHIHVDIMLQLMCLINAPSLNNSEGNTIECIFPNAGKYRKPHDISFKDG